MLLSHQTLKRLITHQNLVDNPDAFVGPASIDLTLAKDFSWPEPERAPIKFQHFNQGDSISPCKHNGVKDQDLFTLKPWGFVLASTAEIVQMPENVSAMIQGRSSVARLGLQVHAAAGFIDCGFKGRITLELSNLTPYPMELPAGLPICQLICFQQDYASEEPYMGRYQWQYRATPSRLNVEGPLDKEWPDE